jgi:hypothetical protein
MEGWIMHRPYLQSANVLLARLSHEVETISDEQHRLARRKAVLQEQITRLRLGVSPAEVRRAVKALSVVGHGPQRGWSTFAGGRRSR